MWPVDTRPLDQGFLLVVPLHRRGGSACAAASSAAVGSDQVRSHTPLGGNASASGTACCQTGKGAQNLETSDVARPEWLRRRDRKNEERIQKEFSAPGHPGNPYDRGQSVPPHIVLYPQTSCYLVWVFPNKPYLRGIHFGSERAFAYLQDQFPGRVVQIDGTRMRRVGFAHFIDPYDTYLAEATIHEAPIPPKLFYH